MGFNSGFKGLRKRLSLSQSLSLSLSLSVSLSLSLSQSGSRVHYMEVRINFSHQSGFYISFEIPF